MRVAVLYGDLPLETRRLQANNFAQGNADILITTDVIGMGLNLPIERVIFAQLSKFDGVYNRPLKASELRQIAGRAGRNKSVGYFGFHAQTSESDRIHAKKALEKFDQTETLEYWPAALNRILLEKMASETGLNAFYLYRSICFHFLPPVVRYSGSFDPRWIEDAEKFDIPLKDKISLCIPPLNQNTEYYYGLFLHTQEFDAFFDEALPDAEQEKLLSLASWVNNLLGIMDKDDLDRRRTEIGNKLYLSLIRSFLLKTDHRAVNVAKSKIGQMEAVLKSHLQLVKSEKEQLLRLRPYLADPLVQEQVKLMLNDPIFKLIKFFKLTDEAVPLILSKPMEMLGEMVNYFRTKRSKYWKQLTVLKKAKHRNKIEQLIQNSLFWQDNKPLLLTDFELIDVVARYAFYKAKTSTEPVINFGLQCIENNDWERFEDRFNEVVTKHEAKLNLRISEAQRHYNQLSKRYGEQIQVVEQQIQERNEFYQSLKK